MRRGLQRSAPALCVLIALFIWWIAPGPVLAAEPLHYAGVVVYHGDGRTTYALVAFPEEAISGIELLRRSGVDLVTVSFGGLGEGVCQIDGEGCQPGECRRRLCQTGDPNSPFWHYVRQTAPGEWSVASLGASATRVRDGEIDGWVWASTLPPLPALTIDELARLAGVSGSLPATAAAGAVPTPARHTVYAAGSEPRRAAPAASTTAIIAGIMIIAGIGGTAWLAARRRSPGRGTP
jgi:hypothetical protein